MYNPNQVFHHESLWANLPEGSVIICPERFVAKEKCRLYGRASPLTSKTLRTGGAVINGASFPMSC